MTEETITSENTEITSQIMGEDSKSLAKMDSKTKSTEKVAGGTVEREATGRNIFYFNAGDTITNNNFTGDSITNKNFNSGDVVINQCCRRAHNKAGGSDREGKDAGGDEGSLPRKEQTES